MVSESICRYRRHDIPTALLHLLSSLICARVFSCVFMYRRKIYITQCSVILPTFISIPNNNSSCLKYGKNSIPDKNSYLTIRIMLMISESCKKKRMIKIAIKYRMSKKAELLIYQINEIINDIFSNEIKIINQLYIIIMTRFSSKVLQVRNFSTSLVSLNCNLRLTILMLHYRLVYSET